MKLNSRQLGLTSPRPHRQAQNFVHSAQTPRAQDTHCMSSTISAKARHLGRPARKVEGVRHIRSNDPTHKMTFFVERTLEFGRELSEVTRGRLALRIRPRVRSSPTWAPLKLHSFTTLPRSEPSLHVQLEGFYPAPGGLRDGACGGN